MQIILLILLLSSLVLVLENSYNGSVDDLLNFDTNSLINGFDTTFQQRRLSSEKDTDTGATTRKTISYLTIFCILGTCSFILQSKLLDSADESNCIQKLRNFRLVQLCCLRPQNLTKNNEARTELITEGTESETNSSKPSTNEEDEEENDGEEEPSEPEEFPLILLLGMVIGLVAMYLLWGIVQERIMTKPYESSSTGNMDSFDDAEFLVLCNRLLGLLVGYGGVHFTSPHENFAPPFSYAFCSMTNILSSWFQYESLKFISFPMQVLAKSCKIIATMIMGKLLNNKEYQYIEIFNVLVITAGLVVFKYGQNSKNDDDDSDTNTFFVLGMVLITCYMICDSFTSNWQEKIYKTYSVHSFQMMCGVNIFSILISFAICAPNLLQVLKFCADHPLFMFHACCMSLCSAIGQLFIFYTIKKFGAVVFATAMTTRSIASVVISIFMFNHSVTVISGIGMMLSFGGLVWKVQIKHEKVKLKNQM